MLKIKFKKCIRNYDKSFIKFPNDKLSSASCFNAPPLQSLTENRDLEKMCRDIVGSLLIF